MYSEFYFKNCLYLKLSSFVKNKCTSFFKKRILFIKRSANEIIGVNDDKLLRSQQHDAELDLEGDSLEGVYIEGQSVLFIRRIYCKADNRGRR